MKKIILIILLLIPLQSHSLEPLSQLKGAESINKSHYIVSRCAAIYNAYGIFFGSRSSEMKKMTLEGATTFTMMALQVMPDDPKFTKNRVTYLTKEYQKIAKQNNKDYGTLIKGVIELDMPFCKLIKDTLDK